jgi:hypothetical protein
MKKGTLQRLIFLRGNWRILDQLCQEQIATKKTTASTLHKKRKADMANIAAASAAAASAAANMYDDSEEAELSD